MVCHIMKTTVEIADDLLYRIQALARRQNRSLRSLMEEGLRLLLSRERQPKEKTLPPLVTFRGKGRVADFEGVEWDKVRDVIYRGRGA